MSARRGSSTGADCGQPFDRDCRATPMTHLKPGTEFKKRRRHHETGCAKDAEHARDQKPSDGGTGAGRTYHDGPSPDAENTPSAAASDKSTYSDTKA